MNPLLKFVNLLHTKSNEKLPHDNPALYFFRKIDTKCFRVFLRCTQVWKWEHRKISGTSRCAQAMIIWHKFVGPNKIYIREFKSGIDINIEITPGTIETATRGMMTSSNGSIFRVTGPLCGEFTGHRWLLKSPASPLVTQPLIQAQIKENVEASRHEKCVHLMTP